MSVQVQQFISLRDAKNKKPLDTGCGTLSASIGRDGLIRSVNHFHPRHGFITLTTIEQFPNDKWYDSGYVRQYRRRLTGQQQSSDGFNGFGIGPQDFNPEQEISFVENRYPSFRYRKEGIEVGNLFMAVNNDGKSGFIQHLEITNHSGKPASIPLVVGGSFSLHRSSYGQLTEGGPILVPPTELELIVSGNCITVKNRNLPAKASLMFFDGNGPLLLEPTTQSASEPIPYRHEPELILRSGETRKLTMVCLISVDDAEAGTGFTAADLSSWINKASEEMPVMKREDGFDWDTFIVQRNIDYIMSCCSIPAGEDAVCVITDHQLLPLSWNRDAYYMIRLLFESEKRANLLYEPSYIPLFKDRVQRIIKGHLRWMFELADRPNRYWGRAYLTNGFCKDSVFQLDQQCYPLLELCDYYERFGDQETVERLLPKVNEILAMILEHKNTGKNGSS
ncbi:hypothetical protein [Paenibacillus beijingensis]|uniref:Uncharacterized protein n=1 Tax=Paenibacillus beijingensis TaxID=1126833 RepID=A0A0D5NHD4_9BACL|nr:hypothetical protein [Paenibacillus beijingensis]AJY74794.1 hypothetical protein VN24_09580 [Paenibacillus beijingensis]